MKVLLDTNVILDALMERTPYDLEAKEILLRAQSGEMHCLLTTNTITDIFYLYEQARTMQTAKAALNFLLTQYDVVSVSSEDCLNALSLPINDFESALAVACAQKMEADYIITRDDRFLYDSSPVPIMAPKDFVAMLRE